MKDLTTKELEVLFDSVISNYNEETASLISGLYELLDNDLISALYVLNNELYVNYYTDIADYIDLARELAYDENLWSEDEEEYKLWYKEVADEEEAKKELQNGGWRIASNGLAICICDTHELEKAS